MGVTVFSPAKINLYLAVTGRRDDGFHDLVSVVAPLTFGDELSATLVERRGTELFTLECDRPDVPRDASNLILKAAQAFATMAGWPLDEDRKSVHFTLTKRIPMGAGLGGGSSNAAAALRALNTLSGNRLGHAQLAAIAAKVGSDCALFLYEKPVIMRGRGERIEQLPHVAAQSLTGKRVLLFKPSFGISTPWAYGRMASEAPRHYLPSPDAEKRLATWIGAPDLIARLLFNNMETVAFEKFIALPILLNQLHDTFGVEGRMSGSGSTCFVLLDDLTPGGPSPQGADGGESESFVTRMAQLIRQCWGDHVFLQETSLI